MENVEGYNGEIDERGRGIGGRMRDNGDEWVGGGIF